jgi:hypothetical protein
MLYINSYKLTSKHYYLYNSANTFQIINKNFLYIFANTIKPFILFLIIIKSLWP